MIDVEKWCSLPVQQEESMINNDVQSRLFETACCHLFLSLGGSYRHICDFDVVLHASTEL